MWISRVGGMLNVYSSSHELQSASEKRVPSARIQSARLHLSLMNLVPQKPVMPRISGWSSGSAPFPISVCATGNDRRSASSRISFAASASRMPPPTYITGFFAPSSAWIIFSAASSSSEGLCSDLVLARARFHSATSISFEKMSIGTSTSTGPGRPLSASVNAFSMISGKRCGESTRHARLTKGR